MSRWLRPDRSRASARWLALVTLLSLVVQLAAPGGIQATGAPIPSPRANALATAPGSTPTRTPSFSPSPAPSLSVTPQPTLTRTPSPSATAPALSPTGTPTRQSTASPTFSATASSSPTLSETPTATPPPAASATPTLSATPTRTVPLLATNPPAVGPRQSMGSAGGKFALAPDVILDVPASAVTNPVALALGPPRGGFAARGAILRVFSLDATDLGTGQPVTAFRQPLTLTVTYDPTGLTAADERYLGLNYWDPEWAGWMPVRSHVDSTAHTVSAQIDHFSDWSVINDNGSMPNILWPQAADVNNYGTDLFSGSATVRYPFELPAGAGGFTPKLNLIGSSEMAYAARRSHIATGSVGQQKASQESGWLGLGFQLDLPYIEKHQVTRNGSQQDRFTLFFGGTTYKLVQEMNTTGPTIFHTESEQFFHIEDYGDYWRLATRDGTWYTFGFTYGPGVNPEGVSGPFTYYPPKLNYLNFSCSGTSCSTPIQPLPFTWYVSKIEDTKGSAVIIGYDHFQDQVTLNQTPQARYAAVSVRNPGCNDYGTPYDQAVFPVVMTYSYAPTQYENGGQTPLVRVYFNRTSWQRQDYLQAADIRTDTCLQPFYIDRALDNIDIKVLVNGAETSIRTYKFTYNDVIPLNLVSIQEQAGGQSLPPLTFGWSLHTDPASDDGLGNPPIPLFDWADNSDGRVSYNYTITEPGASYKDTYGNAAPIPVTLPQVTSRMADPGAPGAGTPVVTNYAYSGGVGNGDTIEPEFLGYSSVMVTEGNKTIEHDFLQGTGGTKTLLNGTSFVDAAQMKGEEWSTFTQQGSVYLRADEKSFATVTATWTPTGTPTAAAFVKLANHVVSAYPYNSGTKTDTNRKVSSATYQYDSYGNVTGEQDMDVSGTTGCRTIGRGFTYNVTLRPPPGTPEAWIVDKPFYENVYDCATPTAHLMSNTGYYYDNGYSPASPPNEASPATPSAGKLTMLRQLQRYDTGDLSAPRCYSCTRTYYSYDSYGNRTSVTDPNGNLTQYTFDATGGYTYPSKVTFPLIGTATAQWDLRYGKPTATTDVNSQTTSYQYDVFGRVSQVAKPGDTLSTPTTSYTYHDSPSSWQVIGNYGTDAGSASYTRSGWTDESNHTTVTANTSELQFQINTDSFVYYPNEMVGRKYSAPAGSRIVRVSFNYGRNYDNTKVYLGMDTANAQNVWIAGTTYGATSGTADLRWTWDQAPSWIGFGFFFTQSIAGILPWDGQITNLTLYYTTEHAVTIIQRAAPSPNQARTDYYDGFGRLFESKVADENGKWVTTFRNYDGNGRLFQESVPIESASSSVEQPAWGNLTLTTYGYDAADRPTSVQSPSSGLTTTYYGGWTTEVVDANSHCRTTDRDFAGRAIGATVFDGTYGSFGNSGCGPSHTTAYSYDPADRLAQVRDPNANTTSITYDLSGRKLHLQDPDMGTWSYGYDATGNLTTQIDARGQVTRFGYDALNRLTGIGTPAPTLISASAIAALRSLVNTDRANNGLTSYAWQSPPGAPTTTNVGSAATVNEVRSVLAAIPGYPIPSSFTAGAISGPNARAMRIADLVDLNLWATGSYAGSWTPTISYSYDSIANGNFGNGRRTAMSDAAGSTSYVYDARGRLQSATRTQSNHPYPTSYGYNDADQLQTLTYPDSAQETVTTGYNARGLPISVGPYVTGATYDWLGRPKVLTYGNGTQSTSTYDITTRLVSFQAPGVTRSYGYDNVGNLHCVDPTRITSSCDITYPGAEWNVFDAENRLIETNTSVVGVNSYSYDALGDLLSKVEGSTSASLSYLNSQPVHAPSSVSGVSYSYDQAGNLVSRGSTGYGYDWQGRLVQVNQAGAVTQFVYDGDGNLAQRIDASGTSTDYVGDLYEKNQTSGQETKRYTLGGALIATSGGYLYADYLRSVVGASNGATVEYTPFGLVNPADSTGTLPTDHQYQGQQAQAGIGLDHMGDRWYDPTIGLWTQPDTIVPNPLDPLSLNRYSFVEGNPLRYRDPSGHCPMCVIALLTAPEWAPEVVAGGFLIAGALTVAIGQHQQEITAAGNEVAATVQTFDVNMMFTDPVTGRSKWIPQLPSLDKQLGGKSGDQKDAHHLIPQEFGKDRVVWRARAQGWQINGAGNGIHLPDETVNPDDAKLPVHNSQHSEWSRHVQDMLNDIWDRATAENWSYDDSRWREAVEELDRKLREEITDPTQHPPGVPLP